MRVDHFVASVVELVFQVQSVFQFLYILEPVLGDQIPHPRILGWLQITHSVRIVHLTFEIILELLFAFTE
jgi:hypothetical protein